MERAREINRQRFLYDRAVCSTTRVLPGLWGPTGPCLALGRRELHEVLREGIAVRQAMTVTALREEGPRVHAGFADGTDADYDVVVGADGLRSWVRTTIFGGSDPVYLGQVAGASSSTESRSCHVDGMARARYGFLAMPLSDGRIYCYADLDAAEPVDPYDGDRTALASSSLPVRRTRPDDHDGHARGK